MAESIGLEAVLDISDFDKNAKKYQKTIGTLEKDTLDFVKASNASLAKLGDTDFSDSFVDLSDVINDTGGELDDLGGIAGSAGSAFSAFGTVATGAIAGVTAVVAILVGVMVAVGKAAFDMAVEYDTALGDIEARTGKTGKELEQLGKTAQEVYKDNWGDSLEDVADAVVNVKQVIGKGMGQAELKDAAEDALIFRDVFEIDIPESTRAARSAVESFGITSTEVYDMMAATIQDVGDPAGDLADTVNEYSIIFAQAGFSAQEMFSILESGVGAGARNFDQIADTVKEFTIRIQDGSDSSRDALNDLYQATGSVGSGYFMLQERIDGTTQAIDDNKAALQDAEGAYKAQEKVVSDLEKQLSDAQRTLQELARPNLAGMEEFDNKLFELDQQAKQTQLSMIDLDKESPQFEQAQKQLDNINKEIDRLTLQRDLQIEPQLRAIEKAAADGEDQAVTYQQALADIAAQKDKIAGLEQQLAEENNQLGVQQSNVEGLTYKQDLLNGELAYQQDLLSQTKSPADELFAAISNGSVSAKDAMSQIITAIGQVDDKVLQNQIGVALFGTKWEDVGPQVIAAINPVNQQLQNTVGTVDAINNAVSEAGLSDFADIWKDLQTALIPLGDIMLNLAQQAIPYLKDAAEQLAPIIQNVVDLFSPAFNQIVSDIGSNLQELAVNLGLVGEDASATEALMALLEPTLVAVAGVFTGLALAVNASIQKTNLMVSSLRNVANAFDNVYDSISNALNALKDFISQQTGLSSSSVTGTGLNILTGGLYGGASTGLGLLGFATGGIVPGPVGAPVPAIVHGGETIIPANQSVASTNIYINGIQVGGGSGADVDTALQEAFGMIRQRIAMKMR